MALYNVFIIISIHHSGGNVGGNFINVLVCANNLALLASSWKGLQMHAKLLGFLSFDLD
jgi:hypothetical protein